MNKLIFIGLLFVFGCSLVRKADKTERTARKEMAKQTYLDKVALKNTGKETHTFTWWSDSAIYQYQHMREQAADVKAIRVAAQEKVSEIRKQKENRVGLVSVYGTLLLIGLMIVLYILYKRFFA